VWRGVSTTAVGRGEGGGPQGADGADVPTPAGRWFGGADVPATVVEGEDGPKEQTCPQQTCGRVGMGMVCTGVCAAVFGRVGASPWLVPRLV
jgi:hypothetical protein